ncbi:hypothetical protein LCGC14_1994540 [marine sediment metagenome]|uniref:DUF7718 domain-containing protein n=1 Tax=marine sediment metagenome TaxID=412755 RepID=A0A0F9F5A8_9ZZZZ
MKIVEYVTPLGLDGRRRTRHIREQNSIIEFVVQYEMEIKNKWYQVVRYDTAHGFAHKDILSYKGAIRKEKLPFNDLNLALTFAEKDLKDNWQKYRASFLKEVEDND